MDGRRQRQRRQRWQPSTAGVLLLLVAALPACERERPLTLMPTPLRLTPVDSAPEGELAEGKQRAFGLTLPRGMHIRANLGDTIYARGLVGYDGTVRYLRQRLVIAREQQTKAKLVLFDARPAQLPEDAPDRLQVEVSRNSGRVALVVRDRRRKPAEPGLSEAERWRQAGLTPDGRVLEKQNQ